MTDSRPTKYDRGHLLGEPKRNAVLSLEEVRRYGSDSFGDPDYVALYGMKPAEWYARGVRLLARTAVECTRDALADRIGRDVAAAAPYVSRYLVVDPFAGSANTLFWLARHLGASRAIGFERDRRIFEATRRNLTIAGFDAQWLNIDHQRGLRELGVAPDELLVVFVAPPWGDALDPDRGLDLRRTQPPIPAIVDGIARAFDGRAVLLAIQIHETALPDSIAEVRSRCRWSRVAIYDLDDPGRNHGILLGGLA